MTLFLNNSSSLFVATFRASLRWCLLISLLIISIYCIEAVESTITCNNIDSNSIEVCSRSGVCTDNNVCSCFVGFDGAACNTTRTIQNLFAGYSIIAKNSSISSNNIINLSGNVANIPSSSQLNNNFNLQSGISHDGDYYASHYIDQAEKYFAELENLPCDFTLRSSSRIGRIDVTYGGVGCFEAGWTGPTTLVIKGAQRVVFRIKGNFIPNKLTYALSKCASENNIFWIVNGGETKITDNFKGIMKAGKVDIKNAHIEGTLFLNNSSSTWTNTTFGPVSTFDPYKPLTNAECQLSTCYGILSNDSSSCAGVGFCYDDNACFCPDGYGYDCSIPLCFGELQNSPNVCSGNGACTGPDTCQCKDGYLGQNCSIQLPGCHGIGNSNSICSGVGNCTQSGVCSCSVGYGFDCSVPICNGVLANNRPCSTHGSCIAPNVCSCSSHYHGNNCELTTCFNVSSNNSSVVCSGNGDCIDYDQCRCFEGFEGSDCAILSDTVIIYENITIYENETTIIEYNVTEYINETIYIIQNETEVVVIDDEIPVPVPNIVNASHVNITVITYKNSTTNTTTTVTTTTTTVIVYNTVTCSKSMNCSNHGECNSNGGCTCYSNFDTGFWAGSSCNLCKDGFYGNSCATKTEGPVYITNDFTGLVFYLYSPNSYTSNQVSCSKLLHPDDVSANMFGDSSKIQCSYADKTSYLFKITFGSSNYAFKAGVSSLRINTNIFDQSISTQYLTFLINLPIGFTGPVARISMAYSDTYSSCEEITIDGSRSSTPYGGNTVYYWNLLNAASMEVVSTFPNQASITLPSTLTAGTYKISLKVQGEFLNLTSPVVYATFTKAPKPVPTIYFSKGNNVLRYTYQFPFTVKKTIESPCRGANDTVVRWEQLSGPSLDFSVDSLNNLYIPKLKTFGSANYTFKVSAYYVDPNYQGASIFVLRTQSPPLNLELYQAEAKSDHSTIQAIYSDPESSFNSKLTETWTWSSLEYQGPRLTTFLTTQSNQKSATLYVTSTYFDPVPAMVTIQLRIEKSDGRVVQKTSVVRFGAVAPSFNVISLQPNTAYIQPGTGITVHSLVSSSSTSVFVAWRLNSELISNTKTIIQANWGRQINQVTFDTSNLIEGSTNTISAVVSDASTQGTTTTTIIVQVAKRPSLCACDITPSIGTAMETQFSFTCSQCKTADNNIDYNYGFIDDKSGMKISLYRLGEVFSSTLPSPLVGETLTCYIDIIDTVTGGYVNMTKKITVKKQATTSLSEIQTLVKSWTQTVSQYLKDGQISKSFYMTATLLRTDTVLIREAIKVIAATSSRDIMLSCTHGVEVAGACKCADGYVGTHCDIPIFGFSESQSVKLEAFTNIIKLSNSSYDTINYEYFTLLVFSIDSVMENYEYLEKKTVGQALDALNIYLTSVVAIDDFTLPPGVEILLKNIIQNTYTYVVEKQMFIDQTENSNKLLLLLSLTSTLISRTISYGSSAIVFRTQYFSYTMNKCSIYDFPPTISDSTRSCQIIVEELFFTGVKSTKLYRQPFSFVMTVSNDVFQLASTIGLQKSNTENIQKSSSLISPIMSLSFNGLTAPVDLNGIVYTLPINKTSNFKIFDQGTFDYVESVSVYTCNSFQNSPQFISSCKLIDMNATHTRCSCPQLGHVFVMETTTITKYSITIFVIVGISILVIGSAIITTFSFCCCCCRCIVIGRRRFSERRSEAKIVRVKHDVRAMFLEKPSRTASIVTTERVQLRNDNDKVGRTIVTTDPLLISNNTRTVVVQSPRMYTKETTYVTRTQRQGQSVVFESDTPRQEVVIASRPRVIEEIVTNRPVIVRKNQVQPINIELIERGRRY